MVVDGIKSVGGSIGHHPDLETKMLNKMDMTDPSSEGKINSAKTSHQKYLATAFLTHSDCWWYGSLIRVLDKIICKSS